MASSLQEAFSGNCAPMPLTPTSRTYAGWIILCWNWACHLPLLLDLYNGLKPGEFSDYKCCTAFETDCPFYCCNSKHLKKLWFLLLPDFFLFSLKKHGHEWVWVCWKYAMETNCSIWVCIFFYLKKPLSCNYLLTECSFYYTGLPICLQLSKCSNH